MAITQFHNRKRMNRMHTDLKHIGIATFWWVLGVFLIIALIMIPFINNNDLGSNVASNQQGQSVTMNAQVKEQFSPHAFTIETPGMGGQQLLVFSQEPLQAQGGAADFDMPLLTEDAIVRLNGEMGTFSRVDVERASGIDLDDNLFTEWEGQTVIFATSVEPIGVE